MTDEQLLNDIADEMYAKAYKDLSKKEQYKVDDMFVEHKAAEFRKGHGIGCYCWACCL